MNWGIGEGGRREGREGEGEFWAGLARVYQRRVPGFCPERRPIWVDLHEQTDARFSRAMRHSCVRVLFERAITCMRSCVRVCCRYYECQPAKASRTAKAATRKCSQSRPRETRFGLSVCPFLSICLCPPLCPLLCDSVTFFHTNTFLLIFVSPNVYLLAPSSSSVLRRSEVSCVRALSK